MTPFHIVVLVSALVLLSLLCHYLDAKYRWQLSAWLSDESVNPFKHQSAASETTNGDAKDAEIAALKERIAALEAIVTEPAYDLNEELKKLSRQ